VAPYFLFFRKRKRLSDERIGRGVGVGGSEGLQIMWLKHFGAAFDVSQDDNEIVFRIV